MRVIKKKTITMKSVILRMAVVAAVALLSLAILVLLGYGVYRMFF